MSQRPAFEGAPVYEGASYHAPETYTAHTVPENENMFQPIDLSKKDTQAPPYDPVLTKSFEAYEDDDVPPYDYNPRTQERGSPQDTVVVGYPGNGTGDIFHIVSICVAILSLFVSPLIELIPMFMLLCFYNELKASNPGLHLANLVTTIVVAII